MTQSNLEIGKEVLTGLLESLGMKEFTVYFDQLEDQQILAVASEDHARLIGRHGDTLYAMQALVNSLIRHRDPSAQFVALDIANYKKDQIEKIMRMAEDAAQK